MRTVFRTVAFGMLATVSLLPNATGEDNRWNVDRGGAWQTAPFWSLGVPPTNTHSIFITITNGLDKTVWVTSPVPVETLTVNDLTVDGQGGIVNTLWLHDASEGPLRIRNAVQIGSNGRLLLENGATQAVDSVAGGAFVVDGKATINGGLLVTTNALAAIGHDASVSTGSLTISNGAWQAGEVWVGENAPGTLTLTGGALLFGSNLVLGVSGTATGTVWVLSGTLGSETGDLLVGYRGEAGQLIISNGWVQAREVHVGHGDARGGDGLLELDGGTLLTTELVAPLYAAGKADIFMNGGTLIITNAVPPMAGLALQPQAGGPGPTNVLKIGNAGMGQMTMKDGLVKSPNLIVGDNSGQGTLTVLGGTILISNIFSLGQSGGSTGCLWLAEGTVGLPAGITYVGNGGNGTMIISNGPPSGSAPVAGPAPDTNTLVLATFSTHELMVGMLAGASGSVTV